jgi:phage-related protein
MTYNQITLNGLDLISDDYFATLDGINDLEKDIQTNDMLTDGSAFGRSKIKARTLTLNIVMLSTAPRIFTALNRAIAPNGLKTLVLDTEDYGIVTAQVEISNRMKGDSIRLVSVQLTMPDPHLYALEPVSVQLGATYSAEKAYPYTYPRTYGAATGGEGTITNDGNVDAYPVITIDGTCSGITVTNKTTGESISVSPALNECDELVIDCRPDTCGVYLNGVANIGLKTSPGWIHCPPGDNQFVFARNSLQNKKHCTVQLKARYM